MANERDWYFVLGDKLPTIYDAAIQIFKVCPSPRSAKRLGMQGN